MSQFYNRYVPPTTKAKKDDIVTVATPEKRKRDDRKNEDSSKETKRNKRLKTHDREESGLQNGHAQPEKQVVKAANGIESGKSILEKYSISRFAKSQDETVKIAVRKGDRRPKSEDNSKNRNSHIESSGTNSASHEVEEDEENKKHSGVFQKYGKSKRQSESTTHLTPKDGELSTERDQTKTELHGLVPIPQPEAIQTEPRPLTYSTLPKWQATATNVRPISTVDFEKLGLSSRTLANLEGNGVKTAFPVQSTVIPLLVEGESLHPGDVCVSAATGSGKTLAYVLPIVESLRKSKKQALRAVIVVPTRELVKQVRETCEMCASGSTLKIVTAVGSRSLLKEQAALVEEYEVYDPEAYQKQQRALIDWTTFSLERLLEKVRQPESERKKDYVKKTKIKADILITTPGRLVDHLQNTIGFHLDDVKWLVVDEADRLLNESYQDWIDVVVPALQSRKATEQEDRILRHMRLELPPRIVKKVLLSATMTSDISKLNSIGLENPKLVVSDSHQNELREIPGAEVDMETAHSVTDAGGKFSLPESLEETVVLIKDGVDKPLLLLQLLQNHISLPELEQQTGLEDDTSSSAGSDTSSDSDSGSDTSSSGSDSTMDSDSTSDSESETSGDDSSDSSSTSSRDFTQRKGKNDFALPRSSTPISQSASTRTRTLIFTRSTAAASRLSRLLSIISPALAPQIVTLTRSTASSASSRKALASFRSGKTPVLIATDRASRGIDVPGLMHVVSYDIPGSALTYVHRVGRTARAGKGGNAWTMVEHREGRWFWNEIGGKSGDCVIQRKEKIKKMELKVSEDETMKKKYEDALQILGSEVRGE